MGIFGRKHGQANDWHKSVDRIAAGKLPLTADASPNTSFPWTLLRVETETYLKRKGKMSTEQIDERLIDLIKSHALKSIAVAACGHAISPARFVTLLSTDLQPPLESSDDLGTFLQILAASSRVNERVVSAGHEIWSSALLPFAGSVYSWPPLSDQCKSFQAFFELSMVSIPPRFLSLAHVEQIIQKASSIFSRALARLIYDGKWIHAYRSSRWLSVSPLVLRNLTLIFSALVVLQLSGFVSACADALAECFPHSQSRLTDQLRIRDCHRHYKKASSPRSNSGIHCSMR